RATGRVQRFRGRPEIVLRSADQIEVTGDAGGGEAVSEPEPPARAEAPLPQAPREHPAAPPRAPEERVVAPPASPEPPAAPHASPERPGRSRPSADRLAAPQPLAPSPATLSPTPPASEPPAPRGLVDAVGRAVASVSPCERARARWRESAVAVN